MKFRLQDPVTILKSIRDYETEPVAFAVNGSFKNFDFSDG